MINVSLLPGFPGQANWWLTDFAGIVTHANVCGDVKRCAVVHMVWLNYWLSCTICMQTQVHIYVYVYIYTHINTQIYIILTCMNFNVECVWMYFLHTHMCGQHCSTKKHVYMQTHVIHSYKKNKTHKPMLINKNTRNQSVCFCVCACHYHNVINVFSRKSCIRKHNPTPTHTHIPLWMGTLKVTWDKTWYLATPSIHRYLIGSQVHSRLTSIQPWCVSLLF